jgi:hypothetical protein
MTEQSALSSTFMAKTRFKKLGFGTAVCMGPNLTLISSLNLNMILKKILGFGIFVCMCPVV